MSGPRPPTLNKLRDQIGQAQEFLGRVLRTDAAFARQTLTSPEFWQALQEKDKTVDLNSLVLREQQTYHHYHRIVDAGPLSVEEVCSRNLSDQHFTFFWYAVASAISQHALDTFVPERKVYMRKPGFFEVDAKERTQISKRQANEVFDKLVPVGYLTSLMSKKHGSILQQRDAAAAVHRELLPDMDCLCRLRFPVYQGCFGVKKMAGLTWSIRPMARGERPRSLALILHCLIEASELQEDKNMQTIIAGLERAANCIPVSGDGESARWGFPSYEPSAVNFGKSMSHFIRHNDLRRVAEANKFFLDIQVCEHVCDLIFEYFMDKAPFQ